MKRFLTTSFFALALIVGTVSVAPVAYAQEKTNGTPCDFTDAGTQDGTWQNGKCVSNGTYGFENTSGNPAENVKANAAAQNAAAQTPTDLKEKTDDAYGGVMTRIMSLFAWLVGVAAILLDNVVYYTVVKMGDFVHNLSAIGVTWRILRDLGNIMLIFGFLAVGITTIMNVNWYGTGKKMLPMMFVAAIFLNFSLFISEAIIDTGNLFATQFYTQINGGNPAGTKDFDPGSLFTTNEGISTKIMSQLGLQTIYGDAIKQDKAYLFKGANQWFVGFMGILLFIVTAFVLFSLSFVLIARFVALIFLIILSPIGFAGLAVPQLAAKAGKWWDTLFEQTITAPILLLMLYIALTVITDVKFLTGFGVNGGASGATGFWTGFVNNANLPGFAGMMLSFLVAIGLLLLVVVQSKSLSAVGAAGASKLAGKLTFGATAWAGRGTVGWGANRVAKSLRGTALARVPLVGTGLVKGLDKVATGSFDVRGTGALKNFPGGGIDAGAAQKGGYRADLKGRIESRTKYAKELTGKELTTEEKRQQIVLQNEIKKLQKEKEDATSESEVKELETKIKEKETQIEEMESKTAKGAQRKYASRLELDYLGLTKDSTFNKYFNFAANTDAAKKIRDEAKKSKSDQEIEILKKFIAESGKPKDEPKAETKAEAPK